MFQKTFLTPFYISTFLQSAFKLITPFYIIYFFSLGLEFWQIALISSFRSAVGLLCEIPTGVIADLYGKKFSVILGYILSALTVFCVPFFHDFVWLIILFSIDALVETLFTGSDNAWVVDRIEKEDPTQMKNFFLRKKSIGNIGIIVTGILGGMVVKYLGMDYLWYGCGIGTLLAALFLFFVPDGKRGYQEDVLLGEQFFGHLKHSFNYLLKHKTLRILFCALGLFLVVDELAGLIRAPYLENLGFPVENLGYLSSIIATGGVILPFLVEKLLHVKKNPAIILGSLILSFAVLVAVAGSFSSILIIIFVYILYSFIDSIIFPIDTMLTNQMIEANKRATILSMKSTIENISGIIGAPLVGWLLGYITFSQGLLLVAILLVVVAMMYFIVGNIKKGAYHQAPT